MEVQQAPLEEQKIKTYEYRCSHEYLGKHVLQQMFIVEKKPEETIGTASQPTPPPPPATAEKIVVCASCSEVCHDRVKAVPLVSYREMYCQCSCKKDGKSFDKERKLYTKDILRQDGMITIHAALTSALASTCDALSKTRVYPTAEPGSLVSLVDSLSMTNDIYEMSNEARRISGNIHVPGELCPGAYVAGTIASAFLARGYDSRVAVVIPLTSKVIPGKSCRWFVQVHKETWHDIKFPVNNPPLDPASQKVYVTVVINVFGFVSALDVSQLSASVVSTFARKLLEYDVYRRTVSDNPDNFSTTDANLLLLERAMGKSVSKTLADLYQTNEEVTAEVSDIHRRLTMTIRREGTRDAQELDDELKALMDMYENENYTCPLLAGWMKEWNHHFGSALAEYLRITFIKWESVIGAEKTIGALAGIGIVQALEGALQHPLHEAVNVHLIALEFFRHLFEKYTDHLITHKIWLPIIAVLEDSATKHGLCWAEPVVYLLGVVARTAARAISQHFAQDRARNVIPHVRALIPLMRAILEMNDPATIVSTVEVLRYILTEDFSACFEEMSATLLPALKTIPHRSKNLSAVMDALENINRRRTASIAT